VTIERDRAHRAAAAGGGRVQLRTLSWGHESRRLALRQARRARKRVGALTDHQHVLAVLQHAARQGDRIGDPVDAGHGAAREAVAFHDRGVHLDRARIGQDGAAPGVEAGMVFQRPDGGLDRVERSPVGGQHAPARPHRRPYPFAQLLEPLARIGARPAVDDQCRDADDVIARWSHGHQCVTTPLGSASPAITLLSVPGPSNS
jgi:hypothetical protein